MFIFSADAIATKSVDNIAEGQKIPFIVYINFKDMFGAEQLCKMYLMRSGFTKVNISKRKLMEKKLLNDPRVVEADKALAEAIKTGYMIQMFDDF